MDLDLPPVTLEVIVVLVGPPVASIVITCAGLLTQRPLIRGLLLVIGITGLIVSAFWIFIALRIEAIEKRSHGGGATVSISRAT